MAISVYEQLNSMGLNIDRPTLQQVSESILKRAQEKNSHYETTFTPNNTNNTNFFQSRDLGIDIYNNTRVDLKTANQIALNNSGLQIQLSQETLSQICYLNTAAAEKVQKNVDGKIAIPTTEITLKEQSTPVNSKNRIVTNNTAKDKNGSNPFYHGELLMKETSDKKDEFKDEQKTITTSVFG